MLDISPELENIARAFCPLVSFHPQERFLPCGVDFFVERCHLSQRTAGGRRVVIPRGELSIEKLTSTIAHVALADGYFLDLDQPGDRAGVSSGHLSAVPVYCHIKRVTISPSDEVLELNYMFLFAYSGSYEVLWAEKGGHDGDWEHLTVRANPRTGNLIAVYYSAHRHGDGTWVPADRVPFDHDTGRLLAFCALNGHGMHPKAGRNVRVFGLANDVTSSVGRRWSSRKCIVVVPPGAHEKGRLVAADLPEVRDRGASYRKPHQAPSAQYKLPGPAFGFNDGVVPVTEVEVQVQAAPFLVWNLRWGSVVSPQLQRWFKEAEHPSGSTPFRRTVIPCVRG